MVAYFLVCLYLSPRWRGPQRCWTANGCGVPPGWEVVALFSPGRNLRGEFLCWWKVLERQLYKTAWSYKPLFSVRGVRHVARWTVWSVGSWEGCSVPEFLLKGSISPLLWGCLSRHAWKALLNVMQYWHSSESISLNAMPYRWEAFVSQFGSSPSSDL